MGTHRGRDTGTSGVGPKGPRAEAGLGLATISVSLLIVAVLSVVAMKTFAGSTSTAGASGQSFGPDVSQAYAVQAQTDLSNAMQQIQDVAVSDGGFSGLDLSQFGVRAGPSASAGQVSGAVASDASGLGGGGDGGGSVTLATRASPDVCWYVWFSNSATWYGVEPGASSCAAQPMDEPPTASAPSSGTIGWQDGSFPSA